MTPNFSEQAHEASADTPRRKRWDDEYLSMPVEVEDIDASWSQVSSDDLVFLELFAGEAVLSKHVRAKGVPVIVPNEVNEGGTDFRNPSAVAKLLDGCRTIMASGRHLLVHMPPCSSFSRARDRSARTQLRSS